MPKKLLFFLFFLKSVNRSGAFLIFVFTSTKSFSRIFPRSRSAPKSFSRSVVQSFNHIYIHIVEMGYFAAHSTWRYMVLGGAGYLAVRGTVWCKVLCGARYCMAHGWHFFPISFFYLLGPSGTIWDHLGPSGTIWDLLGPSGTFWDLLGPSGTIWDHLGPSGTFWDHLGPSGTIWDHLGPSGTIWDHLQKWPSNIHKKTAQTNKAKKKIKKY